MSFLVQTLEPFFVLLRLLLLQQLRLSRMIVIPLSRLFKFNDEMKMRDILKLNESFGKELSFFFSKSNFDTGTDLKLKIN